MFDTRKTFSNRIANAVDLAIDFATLGEYGLEPVGRTAEPCESRHRRQTKNHRSPAREFVRTGLQ
jgi:hypothetical protein